MKLYELRAALEQFPDDVECAFTLQCDECAGTGMGNAIIPGNELAPPRVIKCELCDGTGWMPLITEAD